MNGLNKDEISKLIQDNGLFHGTMALGIVMDAKHLERFAQIVAAAEREACAKMCDKWRKRDDDVGEFISRAIRART